MANSRSLIVTIVGDSTSYERALKKSSAATTQFERDAGKVQQVGAKLSTLKGIGAGLIASEAFSRARDLVDIASNLNEQVSKGRQIFGESAADIERWSQTTASSFGIARDQALEATGVFGNLLVPMGVMPSEAARVSTSFVELAADLASFNNADPSDTLNALRALLIGEYEPARRYGIALSEAAVQQQALATTGKDAVRELTNQDKILARVALVTQQTALAQGDFARTSDGLANSQRKLAAEARDLQAALGTALIPAAETLVTNLLAATEGANALAGALRSLSNIDLPKADDLEGIGKSLAKILYLNNPVSPAFLGSRAYNLLFGGSGTPGVAGSVTDPSGGLSGLIPGSTVDPITGRLTGPSATQPTSIFDTARAPLVNVPQGFQNAILKAKNEQDRDALTKILIKTRQFEEQQLARAIDANDTKAVGQIRGNIENLQGQIASIYSEIAAEAKRASDAVKDAAGKAKQKAEDAAKKRGDAIAQAIDDLGQAVTDGVGAAADAIRGVAQDAKDRADGLRDALLNEVNRQQTNADTNRGLRDAREALADARVAGGKIGIRNAVEGLADAQRARQRFLIEGSTFTGTAGGNGVNITGAITINLPNVTDSEDAAKKVIQHLQRAGARKAPRFTGTNPGGIYGIPH